MYLEDTEIQDARALIETVHTEPEFDAWAAEVQRMVFNVIGFDLTIDDDLYYAGFTEDDAADRILYDIASAIANG